MTKIRKTEQSVMVILWPRYGTSFQERLENLHEGLFKVREGVLMIPSKSQTKFMNVISTRNLPTPAHRTIESY